MIEQCGLNVYVHPPKYEFIGCDIIKMSEDDARTLTRELVSHFARLDRSKPQG